MTCEIIGILPHRYYSEVYSHPVSEFDVDFIQNAALAHERNGFDRVLIANSATYPDSIPVATWVLAVTKKLKVMIAHRPGFVAPTMAARMFAAVDQLSGGRAGVHIITGTSDKEMEADGDFLTKDVRYQRSREYVAVMKRIWQSDKPVDHAGEFYRFNRGFAAVKPFQQPGIPVFWGGASDAAIENGAQVADIFALPSRPLPELVSLIRRVREAAATQGRANIEFLLSTRVVIGESENDAWLAAQRHLRALAEEMAHQGNLAREPGETEADAIARVMAQASDGSRDGCSWTALTKVPVGRPIANCIVGTVEQLTAFLTSLYELGVSRFILAGYDPVNYPDEFGKALLPSLRSAIATRS